MKSHHFFPHLLFLLAAAATAWEFPRGGGGGAGQAQQYRMAASDDDVDVNLMGGRFTGLKTFANLPYVWCLGKDGKGEGEEKLEGRYDIAIVGAPFDTSTTGRPGARFGPQGIRVGSQRMAPGLYNIYTGKKPLADWATVVDCGDVPLTWLDNNYAFRQLDKAHQIISGRRAANTSVGSSVPRIVTLGGDHATTLSALRSVRRRWGPVSVIHFDSHIDTWDPKVLGGGISDYAGINHGTFLHIAHEEGLLRNDNTSIHAGIRAPLIRPRHDLRNDLACGFAVLTARDLDSLGGAAGLAAAIMDRVAGNRVYVSVDIDVLDPAYAPGTGTAEPGGWTTRELLAVLDGLAGRLEVVGADVVEVAPAYDASPGETTVLAAAQVALALVGLMVERPPRRTDGERD